MFSGLKQNSIVYILDKSNSISFKTGTVTRINSKYNQLNPMDALLDITVSSSDGNYSFEKIPSSLSIANYGTLVLSDSKESLIADIEATIKNSQSIIDSVDYHKKLVDDCGAVLEQLNPSLLKERETEERMCKLEDKITGMEDKLASIYNKLISPENS